MIINTCPKCGCDLTDVMLASYPPIHEKHCYHCGWSWTEKSEHITRIPFIPFEENSNRKTYTSNTDNAIRINYAPITSIDITYKPSPCTNCSNNPANGGSGICLCVLGGIGFQLT